jgi:hypothetical protein
MDILEFARELVEKSQLYIHNDYEDVCLKVVFNNNKTQYFIKHKHSQECEINHSESIIVSSIFSGELVNDDYYESY